MKTMDGNTAAAYVSYGFTEVAAIYPITPSTPMAETCDVWAAAGKKNIFGQTVKLVEMQSEAGAAGSMHGSLQGGALSTTFTASQGLLLMIPNMYKVAGELLPGVYHVTARAVAGHALSIFGEHSDVMACRQTGCAMLATNSVQEVMDLAGVAHLAAIKTRVPFVHFFDGFRTSHEVQKVETIEQEELAPLIDQKALAEFRARALTPNKPELRGTAQNPDVFFQAKEASNNFYEAVPDAVADYMKEITKLTGREYKPFNYYGAADAENVIIAMGSVCEVAEETIDYLISKGEKVGLIKVHLYRPFSAKYFFDALPKTVKKVAVLDRTKEQGALGQPLYEDVRTLFYDADIRPIVVGGVYGLGSKDTTPGQIIAVFDNLKEAAPKNGFTIGITDDVTNHSLAVKEEIETTPEGTIQCKFWGLGADGTVGANKSAIKIIGDNTDLYAQGYFAYDSKKSGGITISHLRFGKKPIKSPYLITSANYIACHNRAYVYQYDLLQGLKTGGKFVLNCPWLTIEELNEKLPARLKKDIANKKAEFYVIDAVKIAREIGLGGRINMIMQTAFFKLANVLPIEEAVNLLKDSIKKTYGKKGDAIVKMNWDAVDAGLNALVPVAVPADWANANDDEVKDEANLPAFVKNIMNPMNAQLGDNLPVSAFKGREDGTFPTATSQYEKRRIAVTVPEWQIDNCIQCNQCSFVCPHAVIRPYLLTEEEKAKAPATFATKPATGIKGYEYRLQVTPADCTGCAKCVEACPVNAKSRDAKTDKFALIMKSEEEQYELQQSNWDFAQTISAKDELANRKQVKGSQFIKPLLEFSGACAGCGETAYVKYITQLAGDRMVVANATGCTSIWGGSAPAVPYTTNHEGHGPAWANSLFEDNAEYGFGMALAAKQMRERIAELATKAIEEGNISEATKAALTEWLEKKDDGEGSKEASKKVLAAIEADKSNAAIAEIIDKKDYLIKRSFWIIGGDGWGYDIGYGGVDHVLASGEDINILVVDTEVYSNTGGQASKSSPTASVAKFTANGKKIRKKDLGMMAMSYGYVYVAQVCNGYDKNQVVKAITEAEGYNGPSLIIAYAPCINHGIKVGMGKSITEEKRAVEVGYWQIYRYNPTLIEQGKNPFSLDSKEPNYEEFNGFLLGENRYTTLQKQFPEIAEELFARAEEDAKARYATYKRLSVAEWN